MHITFFMAFLSENFCIIVTLNFFFCNMVIKGFKWHPIQKMASFCHPHLRNICPINWVSSRIAASMNGHFFRTQQAAVVYQRYTEVCFASFRSGGFITMAVINQPEKKVAKRTSVHWFDLSIIPFLCFNTTYLYLYLSYLKAASISSQRTKSH